MSAPIGTEGLMCIRGCGRRWSVDFGHGRLCGTCDRERYEGHGERRQRPLPVPMPVHAATRPFNEVAERDEEYVHDEPLPF